MAVELTAADARAVARALPRRVGLRRAGRRPRLLRGLRRRRADDPLRCRPGRSCTRAAGRCSFRTSAGTAARSLSTRAGTGSPTGRRRATAYTEPEFAADALAVLDATGTEQAFVVTLSLGAQRTLVLAAEHPERVQGIVFIAPVAPARTQPPVSRRAVQRAELDTDEGWAKFNAHYWLRDYPRLRRVLHLAVLHGAALDEADRGRRRLGAGDRRRDAPHHLWTGQLGDGCDPRPLRDGDAARCS